MPSKVFFYLPVCVSLFCCLSFFLYFVKIYGLSFGSIFRDYYVFRDQNLFVAFRGGGTSILLYSYASTLAAIAISSFILFAISGGHPRTKILRQTVTICSFTVFSVILTAQTSTQSSRFFEDLKYFRHMTLSEKKIHFLGLPYIFSSFCKQHLPGKHSAELISDLDMTREDGRDAFAHGSLVYNLYPIDAANISGRDPDCLVIYSKKKPFIPARLLERFPEIHILGAYYALALPKKKD